MAPSVHLLESDPETPVERLLDALGVVFDRHPLGEALRASASSAPSGGAAILSETELARSTGVDGTRRLVLRDLASRYRHVLIYPFHGTAEGLSAIAECVQGLVEAAPLASGGALNYSVTAKFSAAGPFAGLEVGSGNTATDRLLLIRDSPYPIDQVISAGDRGLVTRVHLPSSELFVISSTAVFDVEAEHVKNLDARQCFSALVPLVLFLRHCQAAFWRGSYPGANIIVDDLNLRPSYGFVNVRTLAEHVAELGYSVSIAFIPWNHDRTSREVMDLFRSRSPRLSVAIHGCDHMGAEFSTPSPAASLPMIALSLDRMRSLKAKTGVGYDKVMVFPQGKFSIDAMEALRQSDFLASVNTELMDDRTRRGVRGSELLKSAITSYGGFPLFLRRKANEPLANFALDLLLGKPCLIVTHHDDFRRGMQPFTSLVESLNALSPDLHWTNLETIVRRTYSVRTYGAVAEIRLFASATALDPKDVGPDVCFSKAEPLADRDFQIFVAGQPVKGQREGTDITFRSRIGSAEPTAVEVRTSPAQTTPLPARPLTYRTRVATRRYLSEIRDNYVARSPWATSAVRSARRILKGSAFTKSAGR
jgi:hypothetical protein